MKQCPKAMQIKSNVENLDFTSKSYTQCLHLFFLASNDLTPRSAYKINEMHTREIWPGFFMLAILFWNKWKTFCTI